MRSPMGRPRERRKDLPPGLYWTERRGFYFYRVRRGQTVYKGLGKVKREAAIREWVKMTREPETMAGDGTVAELIDHYVAEALPQKLRGGDIKEVTAKEYRRQAPLARKEWGERQYARTPAQSMDPGVLRLYDVEQYVKRYRGLPGAVSANRMVGFLSAVFSAAQGRFCTYNPCLGAERNKEAPRNRPVSQDERDAIAAAAPLAYRLMLRLTEATGMRLTDVRNLRLQLVGSDAIDLKQSKRGQEQRWEITPAVRAILDEAATLPGRSRSMYVFPTDKGTPHAESSVHRMRRAALEAAGLTDMHHRDLRKQAINEAKAAGMNATEFAGHADEKTTAKHYVNGPVKVKPIR